MENLRNIFISFSLSQLLICLILLLRRYRKGNQSEAIFIALLLAYGCYLISPWVDLPWIKTATVIGQSAVPALLWLFCCSLFVDRYRLQYWQLSLALVTLIFPPLGMLLGESQSVLLRYLFSTFPQAVEFVFLIMALAVVLRHWRSDLLESRRTLRVWFAAYIGSYTLGIIFAREIVFRGESWLHVWEYLPAGAMFLICNCFLLEFKSNLFDSITGAKPVAVEPTALAPASSETEEVDEALVQAITEQMTEHKIYREMGLTIGQLAKRLDLQEYRLRRIINAGMGYRNFNDFLNTYRIREACSRLTGEPDTAVLNIALDIGFRSLSSFNKAFKDSEAMTPTAYRSQTKNTI